MYSILLIRMNWLPLSLFFVTEQDRIWHWPVERIFTKEVPDSCSKYFNIILVYCLDIIWLSHSSYPSNPWYADTKTDLSTFPSRICCEQICFKVKTFSLLIIYSFSYNCSLLFSCFSVDFVGRKSMLHRHVQNIIW